MGVTQTMKATSIATIILTTFLSSLNLSDIMYRKGPWPRVCLLLLKFTITAEYRNVTTHAGIAIRRTNVKIKCASWDLL